MERNFEIARFGNSACASAYTFGGIEFSSAPKGIQRIRPLREIGEERLDDRLLLDAQSVRAECFSESGVPRGLAHSAVNGDRASRADIASR